jgi:ubiquinone/menaquinone biosynthesis C-methylase UbiE
VSTEKAAFDPQRFKEQERAGFNLVANRYERGMSLATPVVNRLLELADLREGLAVLDLATGPGMVARGAAEKVGASGRVVGIDIAEQVVELARQRASEAGLSNTSFEVMDAENLTLDDNSFDIAFISFGLMHFPEPEKALAEVLRVLKPGGKLAVAVWGQEDEVEFLKLALAVLVRNFPPPKVERPSMFRFGTPTLLTHLLETSGFGQVTTDKVILRETVTDAKDYWTKFLDVAGITTVALAKQPPEVMAKLEADTVADLEQYRKGDNIELSSAVMLGVGVKA